MGDVTVAVTDKAALFTTMFEQTGAGVLKSLAKPAVGTHAKQTLSVPAGRIVPSTTGLPR
jgi:hypothetical protein